VHRVCPNSWGDYYKRLSRYSELNECNPPSPPVPLILAGWHLTNDFDKRTRWKETVDWADANGCSHLLDGVDDEDWYCVEELSTFTWGPWPHGANTEPRERPSPEELREHLESLSSRWPEVVGVELATATRPESFTGRKARRLVVVADGDASPPWGSWSELSVNEVERMEFTRFRSAVNAAIAPHEVDHIDFVTRRDFQGWASSVN
jgi:hypothetical protein